MKNILIVGLLLCLSGCLPSASSMNMVSLGMTKQQVIEVMGDPVSTSATHGKEYMNYALAEGCRDPVAIVRCQTTPYYVRLIDGKVDAYGRSGDFGTTQMPAQKIIIEHNK